MAAEYPDSYNAVSEKYDSTGFESLNEKEQAIYTIWWLEAEVNNGGFINISGTLLAIMQM